VNSPLCTPTPVRKGTRNAKDRLVGVRLARRVVEEPGEWSLPYLSDDLSQYKSDELFDSDALLPGRNTYEGYLRRLPDDGGGQAGLRMKESRPEVPT
jgi:hypothetical protein